MNQRKSSVVHTLDAAAGVTTLHTFLGNNAAVFINSTTAILILAAHPRYPFPTIAITCLCLSRIAYPDIFIVVPPGHKQKVNYNTSDKEPSLVPTMIPKIESKATGKLPEAERDSNPRPFIVRLAARLFLKKKSALKVEKRQHTGDHSSMSCITNKL